jgi:predicted DNA-binding protein (UPF0251 family)
MSNSTSISKEKNPKVKQFLWTPKRRLAQVKNFAIFKITGMVTNIGGITRCDISKMNLTSEEERELRLCFYHALKYLELAKKLIKHSQT